MAMIDGGCGFCKKYGQQSFHFLCHTCALGLKQITESQQEVTEREAERVLGCLQSYYAQEPESPISYYEFVIDPTSFARTVENIFHTAFLIRDGLARIYLDDAKLPCIAPMDNTEGVMESSVSKQCVVSISMKDWREIVDVFEIKQSLIPPKTSIPREEEEMATT